MPKIEILAYSPNNMAEFIDYAVNGLRDENGKYRKDEDDRLITGVFKWLYGRGVPKASFFTSVNYDDPVQLFMAVIQPTEEIVVPWMIRIPYFIHMIRTDGLIGSASDFASAIPTGKATPLESVEHRSDLDKIYDERKTEMDRINFDGLGFTRRAFLKALQGEGSSDLNEMVSEIKSTLKLNVM